MRRNGVFASVVLAAIVVLLAVLVSRGKPGPSDPDVQVENARTLVASLRETFESGQLLARPEAGNPSPQDGRMGLVIGVMEKVRSNIPRKVSNEARQRAALAKIDEFIKTFDEVAPKYQRAVNANKSEAAKGLALDMKTLDGRLNELLAILRGEA